MNYGLWMSAAGLSTEQHRQDVISNNLANAQTPGFKADYTFTRERPVAREELGMDTPSQILLERLGGGVLAEPTWTNFQQGGLTRGGDLVRITALKDGTFVSIFNPEKTNVILDRGEIHEFTMTTPASIGGRPQPNQQGRLGGCTSFNAGEEEQGGEPGPVNAGEEDDMRESRT